MVEQKPYRIHRGVEAMVDAFAEAAHKPVSAYVEVAPMRAYFVLGKGTDERLFRIEISPADSTSLIAPIEMGEKLDSVSRDLLTLVKRAKVED